jgi:hypothetical protein
LSTHYKFGQSQSIILDTYRSLCTQKWPWTACGAILCQIYCPHNHVGNPHDDVMTQPGNFQHSSTPLTHTQRSLTPKNWNYWCHSQKSNFMFWWNRWPAIITYAAYKRAFRNWKLRGKNRGNVQELLQYAYIL